MCIYCDRTGGGGVKWWSKVTLDCGSGIKYRAERDCQIAVEIRYVWRYDVGRTNC